MKGIDASEPDLARPMQSWVVTKEDHKGATVMEDEQTPEATTQTHKAARPLKYFKDKDGNGWLCDANIDFDGDLKAQGCWRCEDMAFPNGG